MTPAAILHRRLLLGAALLSLFALAGAGVTLATQSSHAQTPAPNNAACAQQDAEPDGSEPSGSDTDSVELQCGDQTEEASGSETADGTEHETNDANDHEDGGQVRPGSPGA